MSIVKIDSEKLFEKLGFSDEDSAILRFKADLYIEICKIVQKKKYSRRQLEKIFDAPQSRVSELMTGKLDKISIEKLINYIEKLGAVVKPVVTKDRRVA